jgi:hypothetical protein
MRNQNKKIKNFKTKDFDNNFGMCVGHSILPNFETLGII